MPRIIPTGLIKPRAVSVQGYNHFLTPLRKLIIDHDPLSPSQAGVNAFLKAPLQRIAVENPDVEILVRRMRRGKAAVLRGHYVNGRDKVICVNKMETNEIVNKANLLLSSSGAKIKDLKNLTLEAGPGAESARGVWSSLHDAAKEGGGYRI